MAADPSLVLEQLAPLARRHWGEGTELLSARLLTGGASALSWRVQTQTPQGETLDFLLRHDAGPQADDDPHVLGGRSFAGVDRDGEWDLLCAAAQGGVRVAQPLFRLPQGGPLGKGFAQQWLEGEALAPRILRLPEYAVARGRFARQCGEQLAHIHALDRHPKARALLPELTEASPEQGLDAMEQTYLASGLQLPVFDAAFAWLRGCPLPRRGTGVVHGDFRLGNLMVDAEGLAGVLDWELAFRGEVLQDFGWLCVNSWRFGQRQHQVGGCGPVEELIAGYEQAGGTKGIQVQDVLAWTLQGSLRWGVICINQGLRGLNPERPSLEHVAIGRRVSETEADLVWTMAQMQGLALPPVPQPPQPQPERPGLAAHPDTPTAAQLEAALQHYLHGLEGQVPPPHSFYLKVARNALGTLAREMRLGPGFRAASARRIAALLPGRGQPDRAALCRAIRSGNLRLHDPELMHALWLEAMGKLAIDNPRYSTWRDCQGGTAAPKD